MDGTGPRGVRIDEVCIFTTDDARSKNWDNCEVTAEGALGLKGELERWKASRNGTVSYKNVLIPSPTSEADIWQQFSIIYGVIKERVGPTGSSPEIVFDITHSFRSQPMLASIVAHFAKVVLGAKMSGIFYGEWSPGSDRSAVIDLGSLLDLQDWTTNVHTLLHGGDARPVHEFAKTKAGGTGDMVQVTEKWMKLTDNLRMVRGREVQPAAKSSFTEVNRVHAKLETEGDGGVSPSLRPVAELLSLVNLRIEPMAADDGIQSQLGAVGWCVEHGLTQQAYTFAREIIVNAVCKRTGADHLNRSERDCAEKALNDREDERKNRRSSYGNNGLASRAYEVLAKREQLVKLWGEIRDIRNSINHAGYASFQSAQSAGTRSRIPQVRATVKGVPPFDDDMRMRLQNAVIHFLS